MVKTKIFTPSIEERLNVPVSLVKGAKSNKIIRVDHLSSVFKSMKEDQKLKAFSNQLTALIEVDKKKYDRIKETECLGFVMGKYSIRKDSECQIYVPLIGFDIDKIEDEFNANLYLSECRNNPYIFSAFLSPSNKGLRIFIWCESTPENHKEYYKILTSYLSKELNIKTDKVISNELKEQGQSRGQIKTFLKENKHIDTSTSNISRIWFYSHTHELSFYLNTKSKVFKLPSPQSNLRPLSPPSFTLTMKEKIEAIEKMTDERFSGSGRNDRTLLLACLLFEHSIDKNTILDYCTKYEESDFNLSEIKTIINHAEERATIGKFTDKQLLKYINNGKPPKKTKGSRSKENNNIKSKIEALEKAADIIKLEEEEVVEEEENAKPKFTKIKEKLFNKYDFRLNTISIELEYKKKENTNWGILNENDLIVELLEAGFKGVEGPLVALLKSSYIPQYDPLTKYFKSLPLWDESQPDYINQLAEYVSAKDQEWFNYQFKKMLVRLIACAINYIPFNKHAFTFVGKQNDGKTTFLRFLCPTILKDYFKENLDIHNKDGRLALCQNLIINLDELATFSKYDINKTKAFFTIDKIKERLPYDRKNTTFQRRASFFASTNSSEFLTDETGNVRWLVFEINHIYHDNGGQRGYSQNVDIDKVYSQAYSLLKSGFNFKLTPEDISKSEKNNRQYQIISIEEELIQERFQPSEKDQPNSEFLTTGQIHIEIEKLTKSRITIRGIGRALKILGFKQSQKYFKEFNGKKANHQKKGYWLIQSVSPLDQE